MVDTFIRKQKYNSGFPVTQPIPKGYDLEEIAQADVPTPAAGTKTQFLDSLDGEVKIMDENRIVSPLGGGGSGGGLQAVYIDETEIPAEMVRDREYVCDFSNALPTLGKDLVLATMVAPTYDQTYPVIRRNGYIDSATSEFKEDEVHKIFSIELVPATTWLVVISDELGAWTANTSSTDPMTWAVDVDPGLTAPEAVVSTDETQDDLEVPDSTDAKVSYTGEASSSVLTLTLPEGTGTETYKIGVTVVSLNQGMSVAVTTTNSQQVFFPDATLDDGINNLDASTKIVLFWDQARYLYTDTWEPTYVDLLSILAEDEAVINAAGEISSTVEDTALWPDDNTGNKVRRGQLALSTSASTTITGCETEYPQLWANAPVAWRSGSDLVVPVMGVKSGQSQWIDYTKTIDSASNSLGNGTVEFLNYRINGSSIDIRGRILLGSTSVIGSSMQWKLLPDGFTRVKATDYYAEGQSRVVYANNAGSDYVGYVTYFNPNDNFLFWKQNPNGFVDTSTPFAWGNGDSITFEISGIEIQEIQNQTPTIYLYDNTVSTSLGLNQPLATVETPGAMQVSYLVSQGNSNGIVLTNSAQKVNFTVTDALGVSPNSGEQTDFTISESGTYLVKVRCMISAGTAGSRINASLTLDAVTAANDIAFTPDPAESFTWIRIEKLLKINAGQVLNFQLTDADNVGGMQVYSGGGSSSYRSFDIMRID